jgi:hypothetical protein
VGRAVDFFHLRLGVSLANRHTGLREALLPQRLWHRQSSAGVTGESRIEHENLVLLLEDLVNAKNA